VFERSSKAFFSFAFFFRCARFFSSDEKKFARREKTQALFFTFFVSLSSFLQESQKNFSFFLRREKRDIKKTENTKAQIKEMPFSSSSSSSSSSSRKALFRLFALSSVVLSHSSSRGRAAGADGVFFKNNNARRFFLSLFSTSSSLKDDDDSFDDDLKTTKTRKKKERFQGLENNNNDKNEGGIQFATAMTTTFLNSGENGGGEKEDAKMVREAMEEVVERATKKLNGKVPTFAMLFATPEAMRNLTTTTGKEEDEDEKKKKKKKMAKSGGVSSSSSSSLPKLCRELLRKKIKGSEDVKLIGGVVESIISGHAQTQNGVSLTLASFPSAGASCETFRSSGDDLPSVRWKEVIEGDARGDSTVCLTFCAPSFSYAEVVAEPDVFDDDTEEEEDEDESDDVEDDDGDEDDDDRKKSKRNVAALRPTFRPTLDSFLTRLQHAVPNNLVCFGGALENESEKHSALFCDDDVYSSSSYSGCVGVLLYGDGGFEVKSSSFSEGKPIGKAMKVTKASRDGTEIIELDNEPARMRILSVLAKSGATPDDEDKKVSVGIGGFPENRVGEDSYAFARGEVVSLGGRAYVLPGGVTRFSPGSLGINGATVQEGAIAQIHIDENDSSSRERMQKKFGKIAASKPAGTLFFSDVRSNRMLAADFAEMIGSKAAVAGAYLRKEICGVGFKEKERFAVTKSSSTVLAFYNKGTKNSSE
jgi:small ligand-binding sensory domain FIST